MVFLFGQMAVDDGGVSSVHLDGGRHAEHVFGEGAEVLREAEQVTLADRNRAQLADPVVAVAEDVAVESLQMGQGVPARQAGTPKFDQPVARQFRLGLGDLGGIDDTEHA
ncbi:MAG: hypothetical protein JO063_00380, partial [Pseudonocardiales bacterium]|nr:hypothetical protein [Pseudonocardiales bacterium]